tara:strand:- start:1583 stop:2926 length:1344 start_codon:yes stop_codon:yes gene_type:complete
MSLFDDDEKAVRKTVRILVYPNITFQKDLEKDSYIQVIKKQIALLNELRDDLWFYLILPCHVPSLDFDNVTQWYAYFVTYPPTMRSHFNVDVLKGFASPHLDFDLVMSHLPEHTHAVKNVLYNVTHHTPSFFGYSHWFDLDEVVAWPQGSFLQNMCGLLEYDRCYLNTEHQRAMVLKQAGQHFNGATIQQLGKILTVQHLGVDESDIVTEINTKPERIIVFNHRPDTYKNFNGFMETVDELWSRRQDFKVWIPLLEKPNREFVVTDKYDKQGYYKRLRDCHVGFSPRQSYGGWSISTTDGMMNGIPYVMYDDTYYHELHDGADLFASNIGGANLLSVYLDDLDYRNKKAQRAIDHIREKLIYKDKMVTMSAYMDGLLQRQRAVKHTDKFKEILGWLEKGPMTKHEIIKKLGWGVGIKWGPYRRALMNHPRVFDVMDHYPLYSLNSKK